ncbi:MAG: hypothetical protein S4CHLAM45_15070 [Chlamydiales bacterium]|nr:hypothetical protein [Chlamydiales bacterium]MCH9620124.1 hypothetical protein [Chlamydiales bacterium]MCH9623594.1 hypothetical protein [Chlamydiales bacterium]
MSDGIKAFWLGVFIIITLAIAAWLLLFLRPTVGDGGEVLTVRFVNIQNVSIGTRVAFAGKPVGEVIKISEIPDARALPATSNGDIYFYQLELEVDSSVQVFSYDEILFSTAGLLGEKSISINPKAAPAGAPPPANITHDILYARSSDSLEQTLAQMTDVADVIESTMQQVGEFLDVNMEPFHTTLLSVTNAMGQADLFLKDLNDSKLIDKMSSGEGTLGKLLNSDSFYLQMQALMCKIETVMNDISNYGLLFQYDKSWQRKRLAKENQLKQMCTPTAAVNFFNNEMCEISNTLDRVERMLSTVDCPEQDACFAESFRELIGRVECLQRSLQNYNEMMFKEYCNRCY